MRFSTVPLHRHQPPPFQDVSAAVPTIKTTAGEGEEENNKNSTETFESNANVSHSPHNELENHFHKRFSPNQYSNSRSPAHIQIPNGNIILNDIDLNTTTVTGMKPPLPPSTSSQKVNFFPSSFPNTTISPGVTRRSSATSSSIHLRSSSSRQPRVHPHAVFQTYLSLCLTLLLIFIRRSSRNSASNAILHQQVQLPGEQNSRLQIHLYAAPKPYIGNDRDLQLRALESWLSLTPIPQITLLGDVAGVEQIAKAYKVKHEPRIDTSFLGVPLLNSVLYTIVNGSLSKSTTKNGKKTDHVVVSVLLNADIVLFDDFVLAIRKLRTFSSSQTSSKRTYQKNEASSSSSSSSSLPWLAIAARWDVPSSITKLLPVQGPRRYKHFSHAMRVAAMQHSRNAGVLRTYGGVDIWAWENAPSFGRIPPFTLGRGRYDNWMTHVAINAGTHRVVDISESVTITHVQHDHHLILGNPMSSSNVTSNTEFWSMQTSRGFETIINGLLAAKAHGNYHAQMGTVLHAPWKLTSCHEEIPLCLFVRKRPHSCRCEHSPFVSRAHNDPFIVTGSNVIFCGLLSVDHGTLPINETSRWKISGYSSNGDEDEDDDDAMIDEQHRRNHRQSKYHKTSKKIFGMPLTRKDILTTVFNRTNSEMIILLVADYSQRRLVQETVCSMRTSKIFQWLVIVALDDDMYRFCALQGFAVYLVDYDDSMISNHEQFRSLARLQSIYEILSLRSHTMIFSISAGTIFQTNPWTYLHKITKKKKNQNPFDIAFLPGLFPPQTKQISLFSSRTYSLHQTVADTASIAALFVRPTNAALTLLKNVMAEMERSDRKAGPILRELVCGKKGQFMTKDGFCQVKYGAIAHLFDIDLFRPLLEESCPSCSKRSKPIAFLPFALPKGKEMVDNIITTIRASGLSRMLDGEDYCIW